MALARDIVAVPLVGGIDTKTDAKVVLPGKLVALENGEFTKGGSVRKRAGHTAIPNIDTDGNEITDALSVAPFGNSFVLLGRSSAYVLDRVKNAWSRLGPYTPLTYRSHAVAQTSTAQINPDLAVANGVMVVAWEDSRGGVRCSVYDEASGAALLSDQLIAATGSLPRVIAVGTNIFVLWYNSSATALEAKIVQTANVELSASITIAANVLINQAEFHEYDAVAGNGVLYVAFQQDPAVADVGKVFMVNGSGSVTATIDIGAVPVALNSGPVLGYDTEHNRLFVAVTEFSDDELHVYVYDQTLHELAAIATGRTGFKRMAIGPNALGGFSVWNLELDGTSSAFTSVGRYNDLFDEVDWLTIRHAKLASSAFYDGYNSYAILSYLDSDLSNLQNSYFIYRDDAVLVGRLLPGSADDATFVPRVKLSDGKFHVALQYKRQVRANIEEITGVGETLSGVFEHEGIQHCILDPAPPVHTAEVDGVLYTSGAFMWAIDGGGAPTEAQFLLFPDQTAGAISAIAGGVLQGSASYSYRWYYEWTNARGQRVRTLALTITAETTSTNRQFTHTLQTLSHTLMQARSPVALVGYRTKANQNTFYYRVTSPDPTVGGANGYVANVTNADTISFTDNLSDDDLGQREIDYQSLSEHEHFAFDGPAFVAAAQNRVFCVGGGEKPNRPQFSLLRTDGRPVETNDTFLVTEFPEQGGNVTAMAEMNGAPVVFKERAIFALEGTGPTNSKLGAGDPYRAQYVTSDVGCTEPRSVVTTKDGIFFKSAKGIYLLDQSYQVHYVGAEVEAYNAQDVTGAAVVPDTNQIVFLTSDGLALMYDYFYRAWSTYTNHEGLAIAARSDFAYLRNNGEVYVRDNRDPAERLHTDNGVAYSLYLKTAPIRLRGTVQGFWRARRLQLVGEYRSLHRLRVEVFYDREQAPYETIEWQPDEVLSLDTWGSDETWGSGSFWGGSRDGRDYNFDVKLRRQKCSTISFAFRDLPGINPGASYEITELALEVALRGGLARLPATRKA